MSTSNNRILKLFKSRNTLLEQLELLSYNIKDYFDFSINEIDAMNSNNQLDMLLTNENNNRKAYVKYYLKTNLYNPWSKNFWRVL